MGGFTEYGEYDAVGLAELVRKGEVSPLDLCEESIERIERVNPRVNAVIRPTFESARETARSSLPRGPFAGVPFLLKDLITGIAGMPLTKSCKGLAGYIPSEDAELTKRYKAAGVVIAGFTNTPEFGLMGITEPELHGPTRNPWNLRHTPGGSSGGSAAAVAGGIVPMASGGDGGGSIRIPAACCGLFGLKPSRGRTPNGPEHGSVWQGAVSLHVLSRSVRDSAVMLDATHGPDLGAPYVIAPPVAPYADEIKNDTGRLKVAFCTESPIGGDVHPECVRAVEKTAKTLTDLGHVVEEASPQYDGLELATSYFMLYFGEVAADIDAFRSQIGRRAKRSDVEDATWTLGLLGRTFSAGDFVTSLRQWHLAGRAIGELFERYDVYLTPTMARPPVEIGELAPPLFERIGVKVINALGAGRLLKVTGIVEKIASESLAPTPFTQLANLTGLPAMSVPLHWTPDGLPCGVHFTGRFADEATLFRLAAQLEEAAPWRDKRAPVSG